MREDYNEYKEIIEDYLSENLPPVDRNASIIREAMDYSLKAGGKRLRPVLLLASAEFVGVDSLKVLPFALAIEYIHTYSLIHDDLPAMDNDDLRRGKPTNHKVYGEAMAILAGDGLLNSAFEIMSKDLMMHFDNEKELIKRIKAMHCIAKAAGVQGMVAGQAADISNENKPIESDTLEYIHLNKTAALLIASVKAGLFLGNADYDTTKNMTVYAENLGLAFQIADDILDEKGNESTLGKTIGKDKSKGKNTYVTIYGMEEAAKKLKEATNNAVDAISSYYDNAEFFRNLVLELAERES